MAITQRESAILDRADAGMSHAAIARELSLTKRYVRAVVTRMCAGADEPRRARAAMARGNAALLAAIKQERPE